MALSEREFLAYGVEADATNIDLPMIPDRHGAGMTDTLAPKEIYCLHGVDYTRCHPAIPYMQ